MKPPSVLLLVTQRVAAVALDSNRNANPATCAMDGQVLDSIEAACAQPGAGDRESVMERARRYDNSRRAISGNPCRACVGTGGHLHRHQHQVLTDVDAH
jgi:hypothetical protein